MHDRQPRGFVAWAISAFVLAACSGGGSGGGGGGEFEQELEGRLFAFADGQAISPALAGQPCELTFATLSSGGGPLTVVVPGITGTDGFPAKIEGSVELGAAPELEIDTSTFPPATYPDLQPGDIVRWSRLQVETTGELALTREGDPGSSVSGAPRRRPSFVVILSDDQRWDTLHAMPLLLDRLAARGISFQNAYATTPVCAPFRASLLAGGFLVHDTGLLTNGPPNGGMQRFDDSHSIAVSLRRAGYRTGFVGKYMNGYLGASPYVPPGWTRFVADRTTVDWTRFTVVDGQSDTVPVAGTIVGPIDGYVTDYQAQRALEFLDENGERPFFLIFCPNPPHGPATPAPGDEGLFAGYEYRERAYREADVGDKPQYVQNAFYDEVANDLFHQDQLRSLQALDRGVAALVDEVERRGRMDDTVFLFASDNGLMWGEHSLTGKSVPYEESVRVPLIARWGSGPARTDDHLVAANLDIAATVMDLAALSAPTDGKSLAPLIAGDAPEWREELLIESAALGSNNPFLWSGLIVQRGSETWKYAEYYTGERELYDLVQDPFEEQNAIDDLPAMAAELAAIHAPLRGLAITTVEAPPATLGVPYQLTLETWGGVPPLTWTVEEGTLPQGLVLDADAGVVSGVPAQAGTSMVTLRVAGQAPARYTGEPQSFAVVLEFIVDP